MTLPTFTAPPAPRQQDSRAQLTHRIGELLGENEALALENAQLRLDLARERARGDALADLRAVLVLRAIADTEVTA